MGRRDRVYMVTGQDSQGDQHLFATDNFDRANGALKDMESRLEIVRANWESEDFARNMPIDPD